MKPVQESQFTIINRKLKAQYARDAQRVASGELKASDLSWFPKSIADQMTVVSWPDIVYEELTNDHMDALNSDSDGEP